MRVDEVAGSARRNRCGGQASIDREGNANSIAGRYLKRQRLLRKTNARGRIQIRLRNSDQDILDDTNRIVILYPNDVLLARVRLGIGDSRRPGLEPDSDTKLLGQLDMRILAEYAEGELKNATRGRWRRLRGRILHRERTGGVAHGSAVRGPMLVRKKDIHGCRVIEIRTPRWRRIEIRGMGAERLHTRIEVVSALIAVIDFIRNLRAENLLSITLEQDERGLTVDGQTTGQETQLRRLLSERGGAGDRKTRDGDKGGTVDEK